MLSPGIERLKETAKKEETVDLLNSVTVYRSGLEPEAIAVLEAELASRKVTAKQIQEHEDRLQHVLRDDQGMALSCAYCRSPAVAQQWQWHRLWGKIPVFPRYVACCESHRK